MPVAIKGMNEYPTAFGKMTQDDGGGNYSLRTTGGVGGTSSSVYITGGILSASLIHSIQTADSGSRVWQGGSWYQSASIVNTVSVNVQNQVLSVSTINPSSARLSSASITNLDNQLNIRPLRSDSDIVSAIQSGNWSVAVNNMLSNSNAYEVPIRSGLLSASISNMIPAVETGLAKDNSIKGQLNIRPLRSDSDAVSAVKSGIWDISVSVTNTVPVTFSEILSNSIAYPITTIGIQSNSIAYPVPVSGFVSASITNPVTSVTVSNQISASITNIVPISSGLLSASVSNLNNQLNIRPLRSDSDTVSVAKSGIWDVSASVTNIVPVSGLVSASITNPQTSVTISNTISASLIAKVGIESNSSCAYGRIYASSLAVVVRPNNADRMNLFIQSQGSGLSDLYIGTDPNISTTSYGVLLGNGDAYEWNETNRYTGAVYGSTFASGSILVTFMEI